MNRIIVFLCGFCSLFFSSCKEKAEFTSLEVEDFSRCLQEEVVQCVDVRTLAEYTEGHLVAAVHLNVLDESFAAMADSLLQKDVPVALYCRSGKRSKKAAQILSQKGYRVIELATGYNGWVKAGKEVER